jgi:hypothetical protein
VSQGFQAISKYVISKNEFKAQPILGNVVDIDKMETAARNLGKYVSGAGDPFKKMDEFIQTIDKLPEIKKKVKKVNTGF